MEVLLGMVITVKTKLLYDDSKVHKKTQGHFSFKIKPTHRPLLLVEQGPHAVLLVLLLLLYFRERERKCHSAISYPYLLRGSPAIGAVSIDGTQHVIALILCQAPEDDIFLVHVWVGSENHLV